MRLPQEQHVRVLFHRFRACKPEHRDSYHADCPDCLLIESNVDRCAESTHVKDASGKCLTCEVFDGRVAGVQDGRLLSLLRKLKG